MRCLYKYPQARVPVRAAGRTRTARAVESTGVRAARHRRVRRAALLRRVRRVREGDPDDILDRDHVRQSRSRGRADPPAANGLVPQHVVVGRNDPRGRGSPRRTGCRTARSSRSTNRVYGHALALLRGQPELLFTENETNTRGCSAAPARATPRTASTTYVVNGRDRRRQSAPRRAPRPRRTTSRRSAAGDRAAHPASPDDRPPAAVIERRLRTPPSSRLFDPPAAGSRRFLRHGHPADAVGRRATTSCGRRSRACSGPSSSITTS